MRELTLEEMAQIKGGGKFCDFVAGVSVGIGIISLAGGPVGWGIRGTLLIADAGCLLGFWS